MKDIVENVVKNNNCVGCGLCSKFFENSYIMQLTDKGYWRPKKIKDNISMERIENFKKICPGCVRNNRNITESNSIWGEYKKLYTTFSNNEQIRYKAATGGSLTSTLLYLLNNKKIDGVLQVSSIEQKSYMIKFNISKNKEDIINSTGSRYQPCFIFSKINEVKKFDGKLAIVGKPCEISAMKRYIEYINLTDKVYCYISFLCGGTPSLNSTLDLLKENNVDKDDITELQYRGEGWPGYFKVKKNNKELLKITYMDSWSRKLSKSIQNSCRICTDGIGEEADIVFGDAWRLSSNEKPDFNESKGIDITFARTEKGKEILDDAIANDYLKISEDFLDEKRLNKIQPYQAMHRRTVYYKILGRRLCLKRVPDFPLKRFKSYSKKEKFLTKLKSTIVEIKKCLKESYESNK